MSDDGHNYTFGAPKGGWDYKGKGKAVSETYVTDEEYDNRAPLSLYIAGPMRGYEHHNFPAFDAAAAGLRAKGHRVINPADLDREVGVGPETEEVTPKLLADMARRDYEAILSVDAIVLLPGWSRSRGAKAEARFGLDIGVKFYTLGPRGGLQTWSHKEIEAYAGRGF